MFKAVCKRQVAPTLADPHCKAPCCGHRTLALMSIGPTARHRSGQPQDESLTGRVGKVVGGSSSINAMIWVWGHAADFDHWADAGNQGWDYAHLKLQSVETCVRTNVNGGRGTRGPMHVEPLSDPNPLSAGFFRACEELGHQIADDVGAPIRDGAGYIDFNTKDGRRFSVVHVELPS
jgi:choline dehydrogenase-like flavoprotein